MHFSVRLNGALFYFYHSGGSKMKRMSKVFFIFLLISSLTANGLLAYYIYETEKPSPSIMKWGFGEHNIEVYCERTADVTVTEINHDSNTVKIGKAELISKEDLYPVSPEGETNLSRIGGEAFVINSNGELLYQLMKPEKEISETVYVTPSGNKYHCDIYCAGRTAFETDLETAKLSAELHAVSAYHESKIPQRFFSVG